MAEKFTLQLDDQFSTAMAKVVGQTDKGRDSADKMAGATDRLGKEMAEAERFAEALNRELESRAAAQYAAGISKAADELRGLGQHSRVSEESLRRAGVGVQGLGQKSDLASSKVFSLASAVGAQNSAIGAALAAFGPMGVALGSIVAGATAGVTIYKELNKTLHETATEANLVVRAFESLGSTSFGSIGDESADKEYFDQLAVRQEEIKQKRIAAAKEAADRERKFREDQQAAEAKAAREREQLLKQFHAEQDRLAKEEDRRREQQWAIEHRRMEKYYQDATDREEELQRLRDAARAKDQADRRERANAVLDALGPRGSSGGAGGIAGGGSIGGDGATTAPPPQRPLYRDALMGGFQQFGTVQGRPIGPGRYDVSRFALGGNRLPRLAAGEPIPSPGGGAGMAPAGGPAADSGGNQLVAAMRELTGSLTGRQTRARLRDIRSERLDRDEASEVERLQRDRVIKDVPGQGRVDVTELELRKTRERFASQRETLSKDVARDVKQGTVPAEEQATLMKQLADEQASTAQQRGQIDAEQLQNFRDLLQVTSEEQQRNIQMEQDVASIKQVLGIVQQNSRKRAQRGGL